MADQSDPYHHHPLPPPSDNQQQPYSQQQQYPQQQYQQPQQPQPQPQSPQTQYSHPAVSSQQQQQQQPRSQAPQQYQQYPQGQQQQSHLQPSRPPPAHQRNSHSRSRTFSFQSQKSHKSSGSKENPLHETHAEKEAHRLHSKADPSLAISEAEPSVVAMESSSLAPLRAIPHKDPLGNPIADPDKSNPTRSRWERPLDTIRSFEAAIDGGYSRKSLYRSETDSTAQWNRRSSLNPGAQPRFQRDSYYSQRPVSYRPDMGGYDGAGPSTARNSYYDPQGGYGGGPSGGYSQGPYGQAANVPGAYNQGPPRRLSRMQTEPQYPTYGRDSNIYPMPNKDRSYETVTSAAASGNSDHAGYQTDPTSSDNSSIERQSPAKRPDQPQNDYGIGFSQGQSYQNPGFTVSGSNGGPSGRHPLPPTPEAGHPLQQQQQYQQHASPAVPRKDAPSVLRRQATTEQKPEKRKSWLSRRFSKNG